MLHENGIRSLTLRKSKLNAIHMAKRTLSSCVSTVSYHIDPSKLKISCEYMNYTDMIIAGTFNTQLIWSFLFGENIPYLKYGIYLLRNFIIYELDSKTNQYNYLSSNNQALIHLLCSLSSFPDNQIRYEIYWCLLNLTKFPKEIEEYIYLPENLEFIYDSLEIADDVHLTILIDLIRNCCSVNDVNRKYFLEKNILSDLVNILNKDYTSYDLKIKILKCVSMLSKIIPVHNYYVKHFKEVIGILKPLMLKNNDLKASLYFSLLLLINVTQTSKELFKLLLTEDFINDLFSVYYSAPINAKKKAINLIVIFLSGTEDQIQLLINQGLLKIILEAIDDSYINDKESLENIIWGITNISNGTIKQNEELWSGNIIKSLLIIGRSIFDQLTIQSLYTEESYNILKKIIYALSLTVTGCSNIIKEKLFEYNDYLFLKMISYGFKEYHSDHKLIWALLTTIKEYIINEDCNMMDMSVKQILNNENIEDLINYISLNSPNKDNQLLAEEIMDLLQE